jgi:divinyl chlorophyllide a 8-vinyl-reductase
MPRMEQPAKTVLVTGATGTIGRATVAELLRRGQRVIALRRPGSAPPAGLTAADWREADLSDPQGVTRALAGQRIDAWVSCLASRTGAPADAWAVDHLAHRHALAAVRAAGATQAVLLSAICVQKPRLAFQQAKLAFERELMASPLAWTIVRPTAFFKSLSGQVARVAAGKPYLLFGDGRLTACTPIADEDLAGYLADCLDDPARARRILPVGGPGPALTPREMGEMLFRLTGRPPRWRSVSPDLLLRLAGLLDGLAKLIPPLAAKAELARIGHYYATESMLVWDEAAGRYDAAATPAFGTRTLEQHYARMLRGEVGDDRGAHAVF